MCSFYVLRWCFCCFGCGLTLSGMDEGMRVLLFGYFIVSNIDEAIKNIIVTARVDLWSSSKNNNNHNYNHDRNCNSNNSRKDILTVPPLLEW